MLTAARLRQKPKHFRGFTGLSVDQFDHLLAAFLPAYEEAERLRHDRPDRLRAIGGGRSFTLSIEDRLLMSLIHLRLYCYKSLLSYLFALDGTNIGRELNHRSLPLLETLLPVPMRDWLTVKPALGGSGSAPSKPGAPVKPKRIATFDELLSLMPEITEVFIDATRPAIWRAEQAVPRPKAKQLRRERFSGKQKQHTVKTQVVTTRGGLILHALGSLPGSVHDITAAKASGVLRAKALLVEPPGGAPDTTMDGTPGGSGKSVIVRLDKGYDGIDILYPDIRFAKSIKRRSKQKMTVLGRIYNRRQSSLRMPVEHAIGRLKHFRSLSELWRGRFEAHEQSFCIVSGLINYRLLGRLSF